MRVLRQEVAKRLPSSFHRGKQIFDARLGKHIPSVRNGTSCGIHLFHNRRHDKKTQNESKTGDDLIRRHILGAKSIS